MFVIFDKHENNRVVAVSAESMLTRYNSLCRESPRRYGYRIVNDFTRQMRKQGRAR